MSKIRDLLESGVRGKVYSGAAYQIGTKDAVLENGCVGTLGEERAPVSLDTLFDLASVTKPLVALAFMKQMEEGKVCLDDCAGRYMPEYRNSDKSNITMRQLLTHTSIIPGQVQLYRSCHNRQEILEAIRFLPPRAVEAQPVMYSSQGMILLGEILCRIEDMPLDQIMDKYVFQPLGMTETCYNPPQYLHARIASTEFCRWRGYRLLGEVHDENAFVMGGICGHAGLFSSVADMAKIGQMCLSGGFLPQPLMKLMTRNHTRGLNEARGLGWQCRDASGSPAGDLFSEVSYGHTGYTGTSIWIDPYYGIYAILLTNRVYYSREAMEISHLRRCFHNLAVLGNVS